MQSFILDRHTDPSNPTMKVTQDDKIPIYDSQQDAESDLANLEEGQIVGTKEDKFDIDDMKQYIRNQNVLSNYETLATSTSGWSGTMEYDGFLIVTRNQSGGWSGTITRNGTTISIPYTNNASPNGTSFEISVKQGDSVSIAGGSGMSFYVAYYKLRDYTDR